MESQPLEKQEGIQAGEGCGEDVATFDSSWPEGCPPRHARPASGTFFRVVSSAPPSEDDFRTYIETGFKSKPGQAVDFRPYGLSVFAALADAKNLIKINRKWGTLIASGDLTPPYGVTLATPSNNNSHVT